MAILKVDKITKNFGGLTALNSLSFEIATNSIHGLIGPNGSGKTTFFNIVTGFYRPTAGSILFCDEPLNRLKPLIKVWITSNEVIHSSLFFIIKSILNSNIGYR